MIRNEDESSEYPYPIELKRDMETDLTLPIEENDMSVEPQRSRLTTHQYLSISYSLTNR
jgi:hypothetical protein